MEKNTKNINIEISHECWKKLKMMSINREVTLQVVVRDILDKSIMSKKFESIIEEGK